ncbi:DNA alkylation repair protein [archaeon]|nr:DNA alkylation repair protein [archaeon]
MLNELKLDLKKLQNPGKAKILQRFFKTGKGQYGEGDVFLGIMAPIMREVVKKYKGLSLRDVKELLNSEYNEARWIALLILIDNFKSADENTKLDIFNLYLENTNRINNWNLVDISAPHIIGDYLLDKDRKILYKLAKSDNLWEKRIAIISTFRFICENQFEDTLKIAELLMNDTHDLIHKAVGWMLRELGKRNQKKEEEFLKKHYKTMPRTMLRYAIERFDDKKRKFYMKK